MKLWTRCQTQLGAESVITCFSWPNSSAKGRGSCTGAFETTFNKGMHFQTGFQADISFYLSGQKTSLMSTANGPVTDGASEPDSGRTRATSNLQVL
jgi:hypothetical protein